MMKKLSLFITILFVVYSCEKNSSNCFVSKGKIVRQEIFLENFNCVEVKDIFDITLVQDTFNKVVLEGGENLLPFIKTDVKDDTLVIENSLRCYWLRDYEKIELYIYFTVLNHLVTYAPVKLLSADTINCDNLEYYAIGEIGEVDLTLNCNYFRFDDSYSTLGQFKFRGNTGKSRFFVNYGSSLYADSLVSKETDVFMKTIGDIYVHVTDHLRVWIWGPGNIYYSGNPRLVEIIEKKSTGKLIKVD